MEVVRVSDSLLHWELPFSRDFFSRHDSGLNDEEDTGDKVGHGSYEGEAERPGQIVVLPVRHEVAVIPQSAENDQGDGGKKTWKKNNTM